MIATAQKIIDFYYRNEPELKALLLEHSQSVWQKARSIAASGGARLDLELLEAGCYLHDLGIIGCNAPSIGCFGQAHYLQHGLIGAQMLRDYDLKYGKVPQLETLCRICRTHIGSGITASEIAQSGLPLPEEDFLPESAEEKLICFADKFFSKSGSMREKEFDRVLHSMEKFGPAVLERFESLCELFHYGK